MAIALLNGRQYSHAEIVFQVNGVPLTSLSNLSVTSAQDKSFNHGTGNLPVSYGIGKKNPAEVTFELALNEVQALEAASPNFDVKDIPPFDIPVTIANSSNKYALTIKNFMFTEDSISSDVDTTDIKVSCTGIASHIVKKPL